MAETSFIKTVVFGGYDKAETENLFEAMNLQICELQNELRQNKALLDSFKSDSDEEKSFEALLSAERTKLSQMQVQNEALAAKNLDLNAAARENELRIRELETIVDDLKKQLGSANERLSEQGDSAAAMSKAFIEAQKSADTLKEEARAEAETLRKDAVRLAENVISEANESAAKIIKTAEKRAAEINKAAQDKQALITEAAADRRNGVLSDIKTLSEELDKLSELFGDFSRIGQERIEEGKKLLENAAEDVRNGDAQLLDALAGCDETAEESGSAEKTADSESINIYQKIKNNVRQAGESDGVLYVNTPRQSAEGGVLYVNQPALNQSPVIQPAMGQPMMGQFMGNPPMGQPMQQQPMMIQPEMLQQAMPQEMPENQPPLTVPAADRLNLPADAPAVPMYSEGEEDQTDDLEMLMAMAEALNED